MSKLFKDGNMNDYHVKLSRSAQEVQNINNIVEAIKHFFDEIDNNYQINVTLNEDKMKKTFTIELNDTRNDEFVEASDILSSIEKEYGWSDNEAIGVHLRNLRENAGYSQVKLAELLNVNSRHISEMERGKRAIGKKLAKKLADTLKTDYRMFL